MEGEGLKYNMMDELVFEADLFNPNDGLFHDMSRCN
jgi:hypothetical protein